MRWTLCYIETILYVGVDFYKKFFSIFFSVVVVEDGCCLVCC